MGCVMVLDGSRSEEEMERMYHESRMEMQGACWTKEEAQRVKRELMQYAEGIDGIA